MERYSNVLRYKRCHLFPTLTVYSERGSEGRRIEKWIQMMKRVEVSRVHEESALEQKSRKKNSVNEKGLERLCWRLGI